ncbi:MAG: kinase to dihydroxyacetone kinase [Clostridia bacterium]|nr:kinase to dihydroxyacetone kinase [Clostridia bacterium]
MIEYKFDTQLLIEGHDLSEDVINEYITNNIEGDSLLAVAIRHGNYWSIVLRWEIFMILL